MPSTYTLIKGETLASSAASYTFTAIPSTFTDLVLRFSLRTNRTSTFDNIATQINGDTATNYSNILLAGDGSAATSSFGSSLSIWRDQVTNGNDSTIDTFSNSELYIPNYTSSTNKVASVFSVQENNAATNARIRANAYLYRGTGSITSMVFTQTNGSSWLAGSSFYLYGIKNS